MDEDVVRQELYCHACGNYVQFDLNLSLSGNHEVECPRCGHIHYRVVRDGRVTDIRWRSSYPTIPVMNVDYTTQSTMNTGSNSATLWRYSSGTAGTGWATQNTGGATNA